MRVVHVINGLRYGGAEQMLLLLAQQRGRQLVDSVYCVSRLGELAKPLRSCGVPVRLLRRGPIVMPHAMAYFARDVSQADIIHTHLFYSDWIGAAAGTLARKPVVSTRHEMGTWMQPWHKQAEKVLARFPDMTICVSRAVQDSLHQRGWAGATQTIYPGILIGESPPLASREKAVLFVGRLEYVKGVDVLLRAWSLLDAEIREGWSLKIVGEGAQQSALERMTQELELSDVKFLGTRSAPELEILRHEAQIAVLPSRSEGLPLSLLEAMGAELACVATEVGGVLEAAQVNSEPVAQLVQPESPEALAGSTGALMQEQSLRDALGRRAREHVATRFGGKQFVAAHEALYQKVMRGLA